MSTLLLTLGDKGISLTSMIFPEASFHRLVETGFKVLGHVARPLGGEVFAHVFTHGTKISSTFAKWAWGGLAISGVLKLYDDHLEFTPKSPLGTLKLYQGFDEVSVDYEKIIKVEAVKARLVYNFADVTLAGGSFRISVVTRKQTENVVQIIRTHMRTPQPLLSGDGPVTAVRGFRRSRGARWLGGVCGGIARSTGMPAWIWRLIFLAVFFYWGTGVLAYVLLWIFVPGE